MHVHTYIYTERERECCHLQCLAVLGVCIDGPTWSGTEDAMYNAWFFRSEFRIPIFLKYAHLDPLRSKLTLEYPNIYLENVFYRHLQCLCLTKVCPQRLKHWIFSQTNNNLFVRNSSLGHVSDGISLLTHVHMNHIDHLGLRWKYVFIHKCTPFH